MYVRYMGKTKPLRGMKFKVVRQWTYCGKKGYDLDIRHVEDCMRPTMLRGKDVCSAYVGNCIPVSAEQSPPKAYKGLFYNG